jgi:four helix bundle protein
MTKASDSDGDAADENTLRVYDLKRRTKLFALRIIKLYGKLPKQTVAQIIGKQVLRSGMSIGANYREADQGRSRAEFIAKMGDSLREIEETEYWFELLIEAAIVKAELMTALLTEVGELKLIFSTIIRKSRQGGK